MSFLGWCLTNKALMEIELEHLKLIPMATQLPRRATGSLHWTGTLWLPCPRNRTNRTPIWLQVLENIPLASFRLRGPWPTLPLASSDLYGPLVTCWRKHFLALLGSSLSLEFPGPHEALWVGQIKVSPARLIHHVVVVSFVWTLQSTTLCGRWLMWPMRGEQMGIFTVSLWYALSCTPVIGWWCA